MEYFVTRCAVIFTAPYVKYAAQRPSIIHPRCGVQFRELSAKSTEPETDKLLKGDRPPSGLAARMHASTMLAQRISISSVTYSIHSISETAINTPLHRGSRSLLCFLPASHTNCGGRLITQCGCRDRPTDDIVSTGRPLDSDSAADVSPVSQSVRRRSGFSNGSNSFTGWTRTTAV